MSEATMIDSTMRVSRGVVVSGIVLFVAACLVTSGCGASRDPNLPPTAPASGKVTYKGRPVDGGTVRLHPVGKGNPAAGLLDANGAFELSTYSRGDGAVIGSHKVTIDIPPAVDGVSSPNPLPIPKAYTDRETTPLTVEVTEEGPNVLEIVLED